MTSVQPPEPRDLPPGRLEARKQHLLSEIDRRPTRRTWPAWRHPRRLHLALVAGAIVVVAGAAVLITNPGATEASAAEVRTSITQGLSVPRNIRGAFAVETRPAQPHKQTQGCSKCKPPLPTASTFVLGADGSFSSRGPLTGAFPSSLAYDAETDVMTALGSIGLSRTYYVRSTGNNPAYTTWPENALATWVLHALDSGDADVKSTTFQGREAWALTLDFKPGDDYYDTYGARVDVIVDKETGLLLQLTQYENDPSYWTSIETIHDLELDTPTSRSDFALPVPGGAKVIDYDYGYKPATPAEVAAIVGYAPLLPRDTGGRTLSQVAAAKRSQLGFLPGLRAPVFRDAVTARYGRGLDAVTVTTRRGDRLESIPELSARTVTIERGLLAGATAYLSTSPTVPGYLSTYHGGRVIEITAPSEDAALAAAGTLVPTSSR
jgi:hypothetical protein